LESTAENGVKWSEILTREYAPKIATLAMAIWLHAANSMLTATTMPSAVEEIGGLNLISWTFALYLMGSIIAGAASSLLVTRFGLRNTMIRAALLYGFGCVVCALAPNMPVVLVGRVLQGLGGGCLIAMVYISQDRFFPNRFVPKIVASLSAIWMMAAFCSPAIGGAFSTWGVWRYAYWAFAVQAVLLVVAIRLLLTQAPTTLDIEPERFPVVRLCFLAAAILMVSLAGAEFDPLWSPALVVLGCMALVFFVIRDGKAQVGRMLPRVAINLNHRVGNGVVTTFLLCMSIMSFLVYGPLILIELYDLTPFSAGMVVMLESLAWGGCAILFSGVSPGNEGRLIRIGSALVVIGLVLTAVVFPVGPMWAIIVVVVISNGGFGMMWGFIIRRIIGAAPEAEKDRASSLIPITQQIGFALGAALSGLIANGLGVADDQSPEILRLVAFWLFAGFVPIAIAGNLTAWRFVR
jgi:MFS family permease